MEVNNTAGLLVGTVKAARIGIGEKAASLKRMKSKAI
jgi:hypothetical protein